MGTIRENCRGTFLRFGHRFRARYDEKRWGPHWLEHIVESGRAVETLSGTPQKDYKKTYVHDICVRCGSVVKRQ